MFVPMVGAASPGFHGVMRLMQKPFLPDQLLARVYERLQRVSAAQNRVEYKDARRALSGGFRESLLNGLAHLLAEKCFQVLVPPTSAAPSRVGDGADGYAAPDLAITAQA